jgi:hypothetical protein
LDGSSNEEEKMLKIKPKIFPYMRPSLVNKIKMKRRILREGTNSISHL